MFVGHGVLAFALVAAAARRRDWPVRTAVALGALAAAFGTLPDVDMLYAPLGLLAAPATVAETSAAFWAAAALVHRSVTHSLVIGAVVVLAVTTWHRGGPDAGRTSLRAWDRFRLGSVAAVFSLVLLVGGLRGIRAGLVMGAFGVGALALAEAARRAVLPTRWVALAAGVGVLTHPFGDLLTGTPPALLFPVDVVVIESRIVLAADPTVNLLLAFFVEVATLWLGVATLSWLCGWPVGPAIRPRAALGVCYAVAVVFIPSPSVDHAAPFVASVLAVGLLGAPVPRPGRGYASSITVWSTVVTALAAVSIGGGAYLGAYLLVG